MKCKNCLFFIKKDENSGECIRYPPLAKKVIVNNNRGCGEYKGAIM